MNHVGTSLAHVMVVGGTPKDWEAITESEWADLAERLGTVVVAAGARWLTMRPYGPQPDGSSQSPGRWQLDVADGRGIAIIDSTADGRAAFAAAAATIPRGEVVDEQAVVRHLYSPADAEPDLIVILGPPDRLPPSLVWELAYGELVFVNRDTPHDLTDDDLRAAIDTFHGRSRRFGGLDA
jgi:hypothetical protein